MARRTVLTALILLVSAGAAINFTAREATAGGQGQPTDWERYYYYPYVYYPHNFQKPQQFNHMYYKYPQQMQIPVYRKDWHNFYPSPRPYHKGHHFILDAL